MGSTQYEIFLKDDRALVVIAKSFLFFFKENTLYLSAGEIWFIINIK